MTSLSRRTLNRTRMREFLADLPGAIDGSITTRYLPSGQLSDKLPIEGTISDEIAKLVLNSATGAVFFSGEDSGYVVIPPFPIKEPASRDTLNTEPLQLLLDTDYLTGLVLVRLGSYAVGVCRGEQLINSKVGTGLIHGRHKKGGSSAHRFERHRDKQIEYFLTRVCQRTREQLEPHLKSMDFLVYGGARTTIQLLQKQCSFVGKLDIKTLPPLFDIPEPRQAVLEKAVERVWSSTVIEWRSDRD